MSFAEKVTAFPGAEEDMTRLINLRNTLHEARAVAGSPAVARALDMADGCIFLGLSYLGYPGTMYPEEHLGSDAP